MFGILATTVTAGWWDSFDALATIVGFALAVIASGGWLRDRITLRSLTKTRGRLEQRNQSILLDYDAAIKENDRLAEERDQWMPRKWLSEAKQERSRGHDERAINALDAGYQRVREDLGVVLHHLAEYHAGRMVGSQAQEEWLTAKRLSETAHALAPENKAIIGLATDLAETVLEDGEALSLPDPKSFPSTAVEAEYLLSALDAVRQFHFAAGRYRLCIAIGRRQIRAAHRGGIFDQKLGFYARMDLARALTFCGRHDEAEKIIAHLRPIQERTLGKYHVDVLVTRTLEVEILNDLGIIDKALTEANEVISECEKWTSKPHSELSTMRFQKCRILNNAGRKIEARSEVEILIKYINDKDLSFKDDIRPIHKLRADILFDLGRFEEAQKDINFVLPSLIEDEGPEHPFTLATQLLRLKIIAQLGQKDSAREEIGGLQERLARALGPDHYVTRQAHAFHDFLDDPWTTSYSSTPPTLPKGVRSTVSWID
ncbi:hypothetical protein ABC955_04375 [Citromicrobium bathyomarinum]